MTGVCVVSPARWSDQLAVFVQANANNLKKKRKVDTHCVQVRKQNCQHRHHRGIVIGEFLNSNTLVLFCFFGAHRNLHLPRWQPRALFFKRQWW